jgi:hypothetical protein
VVDPYRFEAEATTTPADCGEMAVAPTGTDAFLTPPYSTPMIQSRDDQSASGAVTSWRKSQHGDT